MREHGLDISDHLTCQVDEALVRWADLILVMENSHKAVFDSIVAGSRGKVIRLGEFGNFDIPDPMGRDIAAFREVKRLIDRGVDDWVPRLKQWNLSENH